jgi:hypothetical protein
MTVNNELERMCKWSWSNLWYYFVEGTEENHDKSQRGRGIVSIIYIITDKTLIVCLQIFRTEIHKSLNLSVVLQGCAI